MKVKVSLGEREKTYTHLWDTLEISLNMEREHSYFYLSFTHMHLFCTTYLYYLFLWGDGRDGLGRGGLDWMGGWGGYGIIFL